MGRSYLRSLIKRMQVIEPSIDASELTGDHGGLEQVVAGMAKALMPCAARRCRVRHGPFSRRLKTVKLSATPAIYGEARSSDRWRTFEINLSSGMLMFAHKMVKLLVSRTGVMGSDGQMKESSPVSMARTVEVAGRLMAAFWDENKELAGEEGVWAMELSDSQLVFAGALLFGVETFIVAHEFGHVVAHVSRRAPKELRVARALASRILSELPGLGKRDRAVMAGHWGGEFAADLIGLQLSLESAADGAGKLLAYTGSELALQLFRMLETYGQKRLGQGFDITTHPPSDSRVLFMRSVVEDSNPPQVVQIAKGYEELADAILDQV